MITFSAWLYKIQKDREGEVKIILVISKSEVKPELLSIPEEVNLQVTIKQDNE